MDKVKLLLNENTLIFDNVKETKMPQDWTKWKTMQFSWYAYSMITYGAYLHQEDQIEKLAPLTFKFINSYLVRVQSTWTIQNILSIMTCMEHELE